MAVVPGPVTRRRSRTTAKIQAAKGGGKKRGLGEKKNVGGDGRNRDKKKKKRAERGIWGGRKKVRPPQKTLTQEGANRKKLIGARRAAHQV